MELWDGQKNQFSCIIFLGIACAFIGQSPNTVVPAQGCQDIAGEGRVVLGPAQGTGSRAAVLLLGWAPRQTVDNPASLCFPPS